MFCKTDPGNGRIFGFVPGRRTAAGALIPINALCIPAAAPLNLPIAGGSPILQSESGNAALIPTGFRINVHHRNSGVTFGAGVTQIA